MRPLVCEIHKYCLLLHLTEKRSGSLVTKTTYQKRLSYESCTMAVVRDFCVTLLSYDVLCICYLSVLIRPELFCLSMRKDNNNY